jgi:hypothetical protein
MRTNTVFIIVRGDGMDMHVGHDAATGHHPQPR